MIDQVEIRTGKLYGESLIVTCQRSRCPAHESYQNLAEQKHDLSSQESNHQIISSQCSVLVCDGKMKGKVAFRMLKQLGYPLDDGNPGCITIQLKEHSELYQSLLSLGLRSTDGEKISVYQSTVQEMVGKESTRRKVYGCHSAASVAKKAGTSNSTDSETFPIASFDRESLPFFAELASSENCGADLGSAARESYRKNMQRPREFDLSRQTSHGMYNENYLVKMVNMFMDDEAYVDEFFSGVDSDVSKEPCSAGKLACDCEEVQGGVSHTRKSVTFESRSTSSDNRGSPPAIRTIGDPCGQNEKLQPDPQDAVSVSPVVDSIAAQKASPHVGGATGINITRNRSHTNSLVPTRKKLPVCSTPSAVDPGEQSPPRSQDPSRACRSSGIASSGGSVSGAFGSAGRASVGSSIVNGGQQKLPHMQGIGVNNVPSGDKGNVSARNSSKVSECGVSPTASAYDPEARVPSCPLVRLSHQPRDNTIRTRARLQRLADIVGPVTESGAGITL